MNAKFRGARYRTIQRRPYLASALLNVRVVETDKIPTLAVTKDWTLLYNPECLEKMTADQASAAIRHEIWHLLRHHCTRMSHLENKEKAKIAADLEVNDDDDLQNELPDWTINPKRMEKDLRDAGCKVSLPEGLMAEEYYNRLPDVDGDAGSCSGGSGATGHEVGWESDLPGRGPGDPPAISQTRAEVIVQQVAKDIQKGRGVGRGEREWAESVLKGQQPDWKTLFKRMVRAITANANGMDDFTYNKVNRRTEAYSPFILPSMRTTIPEISVVLDTSGSMSGDSIQRAMGNVESILHALGKHVNLICCDSEAYATQRVGRTNQIVVKGGGGTDMCEGIAAADRIKQSDMTVVLTDGGTPWPTKKPSKPILIALIQSRLYTDDIPEWAQFVHVPLE